MSIQEKFSDINQRLFKNEITRPYTIVFRKLNLRIQEGETHPELDQIWIADWLQNASVKSHGAYPQFERALTHEMVHAWLEAAGVQNWAEHGTEFKRKAKEVGVPFVI